MTAVLELRGIVKTFTAKESGGLRVLDEVDVVIERGELVAVVGPSGSGKSTLLHIAGLLDNPTHGQVIMSGRECQCLGDYHRTLFRRNFLGFIYQFHHLLPEFTVVENLVVPQMLHNKNKKEMRNAAVAILNDLGLHGKEDMLVPHLSGGEQQRVAIARSLVTNPHLILADEPTGNLDSDNSANVFDMFISLVKKHNKSLVVVTHNVELANKSDRVFLLKHGKLCSV
ncbi:Lipoprotein-releasing system ATP-binding protein LolD [Alphaproteobacteria bacterium]